MRKGNAAGGEQSAYCIHPHAKFCNSTWFAWRNKQQTIQDKTISQILVKKKTSRRTLYRNSDPVAWYLERLYRAAFMRSPGTRLNGSHSAPKRELDLGNTRVPTLVRSELKATRASSADSQAGDSCSPRWQEVTGSWEKEERKHTNTDVPSEVWRWHRHTAAIVAFYWAWCCFSGQNLFFFICVDSCTSAYFAVWVAMLSPKTCAHTIKWRFLIFIWNCS